MSRKSSVTSEEKENFLPSLRAMVFDFDGTLANSFPMFLAVFSERLEKSFVIRQEQITSLAKEMLMRELLEKGGDKRHPKYVLLRVLYSTCRSLGMRRYSSLLKTFYSAYKIKKQYQDIELFSGAREILQEFHEQGIVLILVTQSTKKDVLKVLEKYNLHLLFNIILDRSDISANKTQGIIQALEALGIDPDHALAIGDLPADILEAKSAGVRAGAVTTGPIDREYLEAVRPDILVDSLEELRNFLKIEDREPS